MDSDYTVDPTTGIITQTSTLSIDDLNQLIASTEASIAENNANIQTAQSQLEGWQTSNTSLTAQLTSLQTALAQAQAVVNPPA